MTDYFIVPQFLSFRGHMESSIALVGSSAPSLFAQNEFSAEQRWTVSYEFRQARRDLGYMTNLEMGWKQANPVNKPAPFPSFMLSYYKKRRAMAFQSSMWHLIGIHRSDINDIRAFNIASPWCGISNDCGKTGGPRWSLPSCTSTPRDK